MAGGGTSCVPEAIPSNYAAIIDSRAAVARLPRLIRRSSVDDFLLRIETFRVSNMPRNVGDFDSDATGLYCCVTSTNTHPWHGRASIGSERIQGNEMT